MNTDVTIGPLAHSVLRSLVLATLVVALAWAAPARPEAVRSPGTQEGPYGEAQPLKHTVSRPEAAASDAAGPASCLEEVSGETDTGETLISTPTEREQLLLLAERHLASGHYRDALRSLKQVLAFAAAAKDTDRLTRAKVRLGSLYYLTRHWSDAESHLRDAIGLAEEERYPMLLAEAQHDLASVSAARGEYAEALRFYELSLAQAREQNVQLLASRALIGSARVERLLGKRDRARALLVAAREELDRLPASRDKALSLINMADAIAPRGADPSADLGFTHEVLDQALDVARKTGDSRSLSQAYGALAVHKKPQSPTEALHLYSKAIFSAQVANAPDLLYRWYWELGQLRRSAGEIEGAIAAYRQAASNVEKLRSAIICGYLGAGSGLRDIVTPIYQQLADLLLKRTSAVPADDRASLLEEAQRAIEQLKITELQTYYLDECVTAVSVKATALDQLRQRVPETAVLYPVQFSDRIELLVGTKKKGLQQITVWQPEAAVKSEVQQLRAALDTFESGDAYLPHAQRLYDWIIRPLEEKGALSPSEVRTLIIVSYGDLLTIPFAALHDGRQYVVQRYAITLSPGLFLTEATTVDPRRASALVMGISESRDGQLPLKSVPTELQAVKGLLGDKKVTVLMDRDYSIQNATAALRERPYDIVHLATHAEFRGDVSKSRIQTYDGYIQISQLRELMGYRRFSERPVELLVLSACETAEGSADAVLGLSGIALQAGARSTLATLWPAYDVAMARLVKAFYKEWLHGTTTTKAEALQGAQRQMIEDGLHPAFWAPAVLIGNWL